MNRYELVAIALAAEPSRRRELVEGGCGGNTALRDEVLRLLEARERIGAFLETPAPARLDLLAAPEPPLPQGAEVGRYRIVRAVGSGGSGTVYEAFQESPHRRVALKVMAAGPARLEEEAEFLARLGHPGVAHVYEAGVHEGRPWFAMEFVEGKDILSFARPLDLRARLELMARVCDAVHHGHEHGIVHGDLKPSNVLVGADGPKVIDFGIARALGAQVEGEVAGTPPYMSPEQCGGQRLDVRSDVYSLGAVLYEILAGRRPHDVSGLPLADAIAAMRQRPEPPGCGADVDAIVGKAMAPDREARYASAAALADDLRRHLAHRPVEARRGGALHHALLFARRQPVAFAAIVTVVLVSVAAAAVSGRFAVVSARERREAEFQAYVANLAAASAALRRHDPAEARERLDRAPEAFRGWEWLYLESRLDGSARTWSTSPGGIGAGAASDNGLLAASRWGPPHARGVRILRADTGESVSEVATHGRRVDAVALSRDADLIALGFSDGGVELRGRGRIELPRHLGQVRAIDLDRAGARVVSGAYDGIARVCDAATGAALTEFRGHSGKIFAARFDPSGTRVCSGDEHGFARIWRANDGVEERALPCGRGNVESVAWSPDGARVVTGSFDGTVRLWDAGRGELLRQQTHDAAVKTVAFAPDGLTFASAGLDYAVRIWSANDGSPLSTLVGHAASVYGLVYLAPDRAASFSLDGTVRVWEGVGRPDQLAHPDAVIDVAFDPGGALVSVSADGGVRCFDPGRRALLREPVAATQANARLAALAADGSAAAIASGGVRAWRLPSGEPLGGPLKIGKLSAIAVAVAASRIAAGTREGDIALWDPTAPEAPLTWRAHGDDVTCLRFDRAGETLASGSASGEIRLWQRGETAAFATVRAVQGRVTALAFDARGGTLAAGGPGAIRILDARTLEPKRMLGGSGGTIAALAFSPDGSRLASTGSDSRLRLWDAETGRELATLLDRQDAAWTAAWSPDGSRLAAGGGFWEISGTIAILGAPLAPSK